MNDLVGRVLAGRYEIHRPIGAGGMGVVYEATQLDLRRRVAVKLLTASYDPRDRTRLRTEALAVAAVSHPNVVHLIEYWDDHEQPFLVMELLRGTTLATILRAGPLPRERAVRIATQMLSGLDAAHQAGVVHRDIKPSNVFLLEIPGAGDVVKLLDFGVAKLLDGVSRTTTGVSVGTPAYMAPEQIMASRIDPRTDLHAVGVCLFEMLTGNKPWIGSTTSLPTQIVTEQAPPLGSGFGPELEQIVARALEKDPERRFASAAMMRDALLALDVATTSADLARPLAPSAQRRSPLLFLAGLVGVLLVAAISGAAVLGYSNLRRGRSAPSVTQPSAPTGSTATPPTAEAPTEETSAHALVPSSGPRRRPNALSSASTGTPVRGPRTKATFVVSTYDQGPLTPSEFAAASNSTGAIVACVNQSGDYDVRQISIRISWEGSAGVPKALVGWSSTGNSGATLTACVERVFESWNVAPRPERAGSYMRVYYNLS